MLYKTLTKISTLGISIFFVLGAPLSLAQACDKQCLENIADQYRAAYLQHDPQAVSISDDVRFTENNVSMPFPDASWDTVTEEVGPAFTFSDVSSGEIGIYTAIIQNDTPSFLAIRLKIQGSEITEIEHMLSTKRNLSAPPTPIGDVHEYKHEPVLNEFIPVEERISRERLAAHADGYFSTLELNDGEIRGTSFSADASRRENGLLFREIEKGFKRGFYFFNNKVRREILFIDEERGIVMARGFIDHKGVLDEYQLVDGSIEKSVYREPHSWAFLESFKIKDDQIVAVIATFITAPYNMNTPWSSNLDP